MLKPKLKKMIIPYLKMNYDPERRKRIEERFTEVYLDTNEEVGEVVALKPLDNDYLTMEFSTLNGAFVGMEFWGEVKERGERIV